MKKTIYTTAIVAILSVVSCTEDITDDIQAKLDETYPRLVVEGSISSDTTAHLVKLSRTAGYFSNKPLEPVIAAEVTITDGVNIYKLTESAETPGNYLTEPTAFGVPGRIYKLNIANVDIDKNGQPETYSAECEMKPINRVDSISIIPVKKFYTKMYEVRFNAPEPGETKDFYMFRVYRNGVLLTDTITEMSFVDDEFFNGLYIENQPVYRLLPEKPDEHLKINDTILLETCAIPKGYYDFLVDVMLEAHGSDPFGGQPANLRTNIVDKTKATGYFLAYDLKRNMTIVRDTIK